MSALEYFEAICHIPHRSFHTQALGEFLCAECAHLGYIVQKDRAGNIYAHRAREGSWGQDFGKDSGAEPFSPESSQKAHAPKVCLQAHYDMVGVGAAAHGEPLELWHDGQYLRARDSSLGADNGAAIAAILWLMEQGVGDFEVLFTNDEEVGLCGANALELAISAPFLLNLDSEFFGEIIVGCTGGFDAVCEIPAHEITYENTAHTQSFTHAIPARESGKSNELVVLSVESFGFIGGHSGVDIHKDIASSIVEFFKLSSAIYEDMDKKLHNTMKPKLLSLHAGEKSNSIAVGLRARIALPSLPPMLLSALPSAPLYESPISTADVVDKDSGLDSPYRIESTAPSIVDTDGIVQYEWRIFLDGSKGDGSAGFIVRVDSSPESLRESSAPESIIDSALFPQHRALWGWDLGRLAEFVATLGHGVHARSSHIVQSSLNIALAHTTELDSTRDQAPAQESLDSTPTCLAQESSSTQSIPESTAQSPIPTLIFTLKARANTDTLMETLRTHIAHTAQVYCPNPATISNSYSPWQRQLADDDPHLRAIIDGFAHRHTEVGEIHAGLECGILYGRFCSMGLAPVAMASIGPTILYPHSTKERLDLGSFEEFLQVLERILKSL